MNDSIPVDNWSCTEIILADTNIGIDLYSILFLYYVLKRLICRPPSCTLSKTDGLASSEIFIDRAEKTALLGILL